MQKLRLVQLSLLLTAVIATPLVGAAQPPKRAMTVEDVMNMRVVTDPQIAPDGNSVVFVVTQADLKTNFRNSDVWLVDSDGGEPRQLTRSPKRDDRPRWSPDSKRVAFISDRTGKAQLYVLAIEGGEARKMTDVQTAVQSFKWSPDGKRIAYVAADPVPEARAKEKKDGFDQIVADSDHQYAHISVIDATADLPQPTRLTAGSFHVVDLAWHPGGDVMAFTARSTPKLADLSSTEIYTLYLGGNQPSLPSQLTNNDRVESDLTWSDDGNIVSYLATTNKHPTIGPSRIHLIDVARTTTRSKTPSSFQGTVATGPPRVLLPNFDGYITRFEWSPDGRLIYFTADVGVRRRVCRVSADGLKLEVQESVDGLESSITLAAASDRAAVLRETPHQPADVWLVSFAPRPNEHGYLYYRERQLTRMNPQIKQLALGNWEICGWKSAKDGREIEGILILPIDYQRGKLYPVITSIHGGPEGAYQLSFMASHSEFPHIYAARGYASFYPNFRGSSNYGYEFASANVGDLGGGDYEDIMTGVDWLVRRATPVADPSRLGIKGYSYGGYMAGWIIGHSDRFKAAVFGAGLSNAVSYYSQADIQSQRETLHQGTPWRDNRNMIERSPVFYLQNAKTPSLIYHGEKDERVPLAQSLETYMGLKKAGVPTQLVTYPREGHGLREPAHQLDKMRREIEWIERYIQPSVEKAADR